MDNRVTMVSPGGNTRQYYVAVGIDLFRNLLAAGYKVERPPEPEPEIIEETLPEEDATEEEDGS